MKKADEKEKVESTDVKEEKDEKTEQSTKSTPPEAEPSSSGETLADQAQKLELASGSRPEFNIEEPPVQPPLVFSVGEPIGTMSEDMLNTTAYSRAVIPALKSFPQVEFSLAGNSESFYIPKSVLFDVSGLPPELGEAMVDDWVENVPKAFLHFVNSFGQAATLEMWDPESKERDVKIDSSSSSFAALHDNPRQASFVASMQNDVEDRDRIVGGAPVRSFAADNARVDQYPAARPRLALVNPAQMRTLILAERWRDGPHLWTDEQYMSQVLDDRFVARASVKEGWDSNHRYVKVRYPAPYYLRPVEGASLFPGLAGYEVYPDPNVEMDVNYISLKSPFAVEDDAGIFRDEYRSGFHSMKYSPDGGWRGFETGDPYRPVGFTPCVLFSAGMCVEAGIGIRTPSVIIPVEAGALDVTSRVRDTYEKIVSKTQVDISQELEMTATEAAAIFQQFGSVVLNTGVARPVLASPNMRSAVRSMNMMITLLFTPPLWANISQLIVIIGAGFELTLSKTDVEDVVLNTRMMDQSRLTDFKRVMQRIVSRRSTHDRWLTTAKRTVLDSPPQFTLRGLEDLSFLGQSDPVNDRRVRGIFDGSLFRDRMDAGGRQQNPYFLDGYDVQNSFDNVLEQIQTVMDSYRRTLQKPRAAHVVLNWTTALLTDAFRRAVCAFWMEVRRAEVIPSMPAKIVNVEVSERFRGNTGQGTIAVVEIQPFMHGILIHPPAKVGQLSIYSGAQDDIVHNELLPCLPYTTKYLDMYDRSWLAYDELLVLWATIKNLPEYGTDHYLVVKDEYRKRGFFEIMKRLWNRKVEDFSTFLAWMFRDWDVILEKVMANEEFRRSFHFIERVLMMSRFIQQGTNLSTDLLVMRRPMFRESLSVTVGRNVTTRGARSEGVLTHIQPIVEDSQNTVSASVLAGIMGMGEASLDAISHEIGSMTDFDDIRIDYRYGILVRPKEYSNVGLLSEDDAERYLEVELGRTSQKLRFRSATIDIPYVVSATQYDARHASVKVGVPFMLESQVIRQGKGFFLQRVQNTYLYRQPVALDAAQHQIMEIRIGQYSTRDPIEVETIAGELFDSNYAVVQAQPASDIGIELMAMPLCEYANVYLAKTIFRLPTVIEFNFPI
jgi:hypothetical protein